MLQTATLAHTDIERDCHCIVTLKVEVGYLLGIFQQFVIFVQVNAWTLMFWPLMLADRKGEHVKNKFPWYIASQFLVRHGCITRACLAQHLLCARTLLIGLVEI